MTSFTLTSGSDVTATSYTFEGYNRKTEGVSVNGTATVSKTYTYDALDRLTSVTDSVVGKTLGYSYDLNGNMLTKTDSLDATANMTFEYDALNQMVRANQDSVTKGLYDYNAGGLRIRHRLSERGDVDYFYDGNAVIEERNADDSSLLAHYRYADRLLSLNNGTSSQYYHHDALGSTVNLTDSVGAVQVSYSLDPWGTIRNQTGTSVNRQIFTGQEHDENTGLIYFGARYYDPATGRFISQDSYLGEYGTPPSLHRYLYAYSNPTVYIDLYGYDSTSTMLDNWATDAAKEDKAWKLAGIVTLQAGYKLADAITFNWISKHDEARDKYDRGEISQAEYVGDSLIAAGESGLYLGVTAATGGIGGYAMKGASMTTRLMVAGAASGVGYQAADDLIHGELSGVKDYVTSAGMGAGGGLMARGAMGVKNSLGNTTVKEGMQIMKAASKDKAQVVKRMTKEVANSMVESGQRVMSSAKVKISENRGSLNLTEGNSSKFNLWNEFQRNTKGLFKSRSEASRFYKEIPKEGITTFKGESFEKTVHQSFSREALLARMEVIKGANLYKIGTSGLSDAQNAHFWALKHPFKQGYAAGYGIPKKNVLNADFVEIGTLMKGSKFITRPAPGFGVNPGGEIEAVLNSGDASLKVFSFGQKIPYTGF